MPPVPESLDILLGESACSLDMFTLPRLNETFQGTFIFYVKVPLYIIHFMFKYILFISYDK